ncbi:MAG: hypothetical protein EA422_15080 [Gemmatimonadales bacterium]|nr:MAG: hypothetical protein EA422_15080 [Gemmatimonadales bacterium]
MEIHLTPAMRREIRKERVWEAEVAPLPAVFDDMPDGRPGILMLTVGDWVLGTEVLPRPPREIPELVELLAGAIREAASEVGRMPRTIRVRDRELAVVLDGKLGTRKVRVECDPSLPSLDGALASLAERMGAAADRPLTASPPRWAGWEMEEGEIRGFFTAAARLYRADPWAARGETEPVELDSVEDGFWYASFSGEKGDFPAVSVFRELDDVVANLTLPREAVGEALVDRHFIVVFSPRDHLPHPMTLEVVGQTWPVAAPEAYPRLMTVNTPGGGVSRGDMEALTSVVEAVAAFTEAGEPAPDTFGGGDDPSIPGWAAPGARWLVRDGSHLVADLLEPPTLHDEIEGLVGELNTSPDLELGGLSPDRVHRLLYQDWESEDEPLHFKPDLPNGELQGVEILGNARRLLELCLEGDGAGATAAGNLNRVAVARMRDEGSWESLATSDQPHADHEIHRDKPLNEGDFRGLQWVRILLELAGMVERRGPLFRATALGGDLLHPTRSGELFHHLFRVQMRGMNLAFSDRYPTEETLQFGVPFTLVRLAREAREWIPPQELVPRILLPRVLEEVEGDVGSASLPGVVTHRILRPLRRFGLLEWEWDEDERRGLQLSPRRVRLTPLFDRFIHVHW